MASRPTHLFKGVVVGNEKVGKTALVHRIARDSFSEEYKATVGVDFMTKRHTHDGKVALLQMFDMSGKAQYRATLCTSARNAHFALMCFDIGEDSSLVDVEASWVQAARTHFPEETPMFLVGCKADTEGRKVQKEQAEEAAKSWGMAGYFEVSSASGDGVSALLDAVVGAAIDADKKKAEAKPDDRDTAEARAKQLNRRHAATKSARTEELEMQLEAEEARRREILRAIARKTKEADKAKVDERTAGAAKRTLTAAQKAEIRTVFDSFDSDKSGKVSQSELGAVAKALGVDLTDEEVVQTVKVLDKDADGQLDFEEFLGWWSADSKLGGNKGVKLMLLKQRMNAKVMKEIALKRMRDMPKLELSERTINVDADVMVGKIAADWDAPLQAHASVLPMTPELFRAEVAKLVPEKAKEAGSDDESGGEVLPVQALVRVVVPMREGSDPDRLTEAVKTYTDFVEARAGETASSTEKVPVLRVVEDATGKPTLEVKLVMRKLKIVQDISERLMELFHAEDVDDVTEEENKATNMLDRVLDSMCVSVLAGAKPGELLNSPTATIDELFDKVHATFKGSLNRIVVDVMQQALLQGGVRGRNALQKMLAPLLGLAGAGAASVKLRLRSVKETADHVVTALAGIHREILQRAIDDGDLKMTPEIADVLSGDRLQKMWEGHARHSFKRIQLAQPLLMFRAQLLEAIEEMDGLYDQVFAAFPKCLAGPTRVQLLTPLAAVTLQLKGFDFMMEMLPESGEAAGAWADWMEETGLKLQEAAEEAGDLSDAIFDMDAWDSNRMHERLGKQGVRKTKRVGVFGQTGCGKTSVSHCLATGMSTLTPKPAAGRVQIKIASHGTLQFSLWELRLPDETDDESYSQMSDCLNFNDVDYLLFVVDGTKGVQDGDKAIIEKLGGEAKVVLAVTHGDGMEGDAAARAAKAKAMLEELVENEARRVDAVVCDARTDTDSVQPLLPLLRKMTTEGDDDDDDDGGDRGAGAAMPDDASYSSGGDSWNFADSD